MGVLLLKSVTSSIYSSSFFKQFPASKFSKFLISFYKFYISNSEQLFIYSIFFS